VENWCNSRKGESANQGYLEKSGEVGKERKRAAKKRRMGRVSTEDLAPLTLSTNE